MSLISRKGLAARHAARLFQQVMENLPAGAVLREGDRLTLNRAAESITGYQRGELPTIEAWCTALHGERAPECRLQYEVAAPPEGGTQRVSLEIARKDGARREVAFTICRLDDADELWMLIDVTEQDRAERALRRSEDYVRSIVNTAVDAIITINRHGTIETFNLAAEKMFGYTAAEVVGQNVRLLMPQPYRDEHDDYLARYLKTQEARIIGVGREVHRAAQGCQHDAARPRDQPDRPPAALHRGPSRSQRSPAGSNGAWLKARPRNAGTWPASCTTGWEVT